MTSTPPTSSPPTQPPPTSAPPASPPSQVMPSTTGTLTRVTLVAPRRRVDVVLPSETPLGVLLPEITRLLGYRPSEPPRSYRISLFNGQVLPLEQNLRGAQVPDGALVRVDPVHEAPMSAVVHDVTEAVADDLSQRRGRWGPGPRRWVSTGVIVAGALWAALLVTSAVPAVVLLAVGALSLVTGTVIALAGPQVTGTSISLGGAAVTAVGIPLVTEDLTSRSVAWAALIGLTVAAVCAANNRLRAGITGAVTVFGLLAGWVLCGLLLKPVEQIASVLILGSTVMIGVLPRVALATSGLTRLDDQQRENKQVSRASVHAAVDSAHRGLALAAVAAAASTAAAGWLLAHSPNAWAMALAGLAALNLVLRTRAHPLTVEVVGLLAATAVIIIGLVQHWVHSVPADWWAGVLVALVGVGLGLITLSYQPSDQVRARLRRVADRVEGITVVAMVPVAIGASGIYGPLLATF